LKSNKKKRSPPPAAIRWDRLPHEALSLEVDSRILDREARTANQEVRRIYLQERLSTLTRQEHDEYINCVAADLKRDLRICRDVYRDYLQGLNKKSSTAKARVALDFAVAPMASRRLREEIVAYVGHVGVSDLMFAVLFHRVFDLLARHPDFTAEWISIGGTTEWLIPDTCFQELKEATSRELGSLAEGPFLDPAEPFELLIFGREHPRP
jgi:hypothetical protein